MKKFTYLIFFSFWCFLHGSYAQNIITWNNTRNANSSSDGNNHPRIVIDGSGNPVIIWGNSGNKSVFISKWNGSSFSTPLKLNSSGMTIATGSWMGPDIASKGDTIYVVMKRTPENIDTNHVFIVRSFDGGETFSVPNRVDYLPNGNISRFPTITIDQNGNPIVAFMEFDSLFEDPHWMVTKSSDLGNTFLPAVKASGQTGGIVCDCCPGEIISTGDYVAMLYRSDMSDIRDTWAGMSNDNGISFPSGYNVDQNNWMVNYCPSSGPDGVFRDDTLYSVFMSGASGDSRTYLSRSSFKDWNLGSVALLTKNISGLSEQNYPRIDRFGSAAAIVWKQRANNKDQLPLLFTTDITLGFSSSYELVDDENIENVDVVISNNEITVVWQDDNENVIKYRSGTFSQPTSSSSSFQKNIISIEPNPVNAMVHIRLPDNSIKVEQIEVFSSIGKLILNLNSQESFDASSFPPGIYIVKLIYNNKIIVKKMIKE